MKTAARLLLIALLLGLAACGWRLRGTGGAGLDGLAVYVVLPATGAELRGADPYDLRRAVVQGLEVADAELVDVRERADLVLVLLDETVRERAVSISADARVQEYERAYAVRFAVETSVGDVLAPAQTVQVSEVYPYDPNNVLSTQSRAATVTDRLRRDAVRLLLLRLEAAAGKAG